MLNEQNMGSSRYKKGPGGKWDGVIYTVELVNMCVTCDSEVKSAVVSAWCAHTAAHQGLGGTSGSGIAKLFR